MMKRKFSHFIILAFLLVSVGSLHAETFLESEGLLVMEAESTNSNFGEWILNTTTDIGDTTGSGSIEFTGNDFTLGPPESPLAYRFIISKPGIYYIHLHCARVTQIINGETRTDVSNDCYIRVIGDVEARNPDPADDFSATFHQGDAPLVALQTDFKFFGGNDDDFVWASGNRLDLGGEDNKRVAVYNFEAGAAYTLIVSGRSRAFKINRIVFQHEDLSNSQARNLSNPESEVINALTGTELFEQFTPFAFSIFDTPNPVDLANRQIIFTPYEEVNNPGVIRYSTTLGTISSLPVSDFGDLINATVDDASIPINFGSSPFTYFGTSYDSVSVNSNGTFNFDTAFAGFSESLEQHIALVQIAAFWSDLNPGEFGAMYSTTTSTAHVFTWDDVSEFANPDDRVTFQVELRFDGRIIISFLEAEIDNAIVGLSAGQGNQPDFLNITSAAPNVTPFGLVISGLTADENLSAETMIGGISAFDFDFGETLSFQLVTGPGATHNRSFYVLNGDTLVTTRPLDFETDPTMSIRLRVTDSSGNSLTQIFEITVNDEVNETATLNIHGKLPGSSIADLPVLLPKLTNVFASPQTSDQSVLFAQYERDSTEQTTSSVGMWSCDLTHWYASGQTDDQGVTVSINEIPVSHPDGSGMETVKVDLQIITGSPDRLFYRLFNVE
ncbi:MAG: cadherin repeat domain-containing protein [Verrucomicrobiota bacterium]